MKAVPAIACLLAAGAAFGQTPSIEFNGVPLGAPAQAVLDRNPAFECRATYCSLYPTSSFSRICGYTGPSRDECVRKILADSRWGGTIPDSYSVSLRDGAVDSVMIVFSHRDFARIADGLIEKYGKPTSDETEALQNRMGATFSSRTLQWHRPDGAIMAMERASTVDKSIVSMKTAAALASERAGQANQPKATAKQL